MKEKVQINVILPYDLVSTPGFSGATIMTEVDLLRMIREKEIKLRKDKIDKIRNGFKNKSTIL